MCMCVCVCVGGGGGGGGANDLDNFIYLCANTQACENRKVAIVRGLLWRGYT